DHLSGGNLAQRITADGPLPGAQVRELADRLLDALASAHRQGVVHRDIKPANVLFDADGRASLGDFGAAVHRDATPGLTASEMVVGTPGFMSPEQARGEPATAASDVFSLGATLAFAATGEGPFGTADPRVLMLRAAAGRTEKLPRTLSPDLRRRIDAMLERDPARRPTAAAARGGPEGTDARLPPRRVRAVPRSRGGRAAVGVGVLVLGVGAALAVLTGGDGNGGRLAGSATTTPAPTTTEVPCEDLPYRPCGGESAPHTTGRVCIVGYGDYDGDPANGCEAEPDDLDASTRLVDELRANLVPADDVDRYRFRVDDDAQLRCDGQVRISLVAPDDAIARLTVRDGDGDALGTALAADGEPATVSLREPRCFGDDATTLEAVVEAAAGSTPSAGTYALTKRGSY
ncbi:MAG TPA: serine/threonine-protein kinase, partial [Aquihabitans sp.]|nr:serine/threonine-protein kinase [Aquihabitans sp.]